jgi:hypothetical protein
MDRARDVRRLQRYTPIISALTEVVPPDLADLDPEAYVPDDKRIGQLDLNDEKQLEQLGRWAGHRELFDALRMDPRVNTRHLGEDRIHNDWYPTPDAEVYAAIVADHRPRRIIEIGAGFSTAIARRTIEATGIQCELVVIDPQPRTDVAGVADRVVVRRVEDAAGAIEVDERAIVFIDSSHVVRSGGDIPFLFCDVVPRLAPGTLVHVHDVFLPFDYPPSYRRRLYGEQYVLFALLVAGGRFRTEFATHYMVREHGDAMRACFGPAVGVDPLHFGGSFWFSVAH